VEDPAAGEENQTVPLQGCEVKVSIVIPSRNEQFLNPTISSLLERAEGDIEVIPVLDGYWPDPIIDHPQVRYIHRGSPKGMRAAINAGVALAKGEFILKTDGHCLFGEGYDEILQADCDEDWVVTPRRDRLDAEQWCIQDTGKPPIDYMYLSYPDDPSDFGGPGLNGKVWEERNNDPALKSVLIDDLMSAQGSAWFMSRKFFDHLDLMDETNYGSFWNEAQSIMMKAWTSGGRCIVNKNTYYCHLHKGKTYGRGYSLSNATLNQGARFTKKWITNSAWNEKQVRPFSWLIEHFWPIPGWPDDWREKLWEGGIEPRP
jgi:glycosyltransferase involved in cell wall biosynthesis